MAAMGAATAHATIKDALDCSVGFPCDTTALTFGGSKHDAALAQCTDNDAKLAI